MIRINLATRKSANVASEAAGVGGLGNAAAAFKNLSPAEVINQIREIPNLLPLLLVGILYYAAQSYVDSYREEKIKEVDRRILAITDEQERIRHELASKKDLEIKKKQLEDDELVLKTKYDVIEKLLQDRSAPAQIFLNLSKTIPPEIWLSEMRLDATSLQLKGDSLDFNPISDFQKNLRESLFFKSAQLKGSVQGVDETGLEVTKFDLTAERKTP